MQSRNLDLSRKEETDSKMLLPVTKNQKQQDKNDKIHKWNLNFSVKMDLYKT